MSTTNGIADGEHDLTLDTVDRGDNHGSVTRRIKIDNTPPAAPEMVAVEGGDGWRPTNAFDVTWKNPTDDAAPIVGADYRLCPAAAGDAGCVSGSVTRDVSKITSLAVPHPGEWSLKVWLRDAAGNSRPETAAAPVFLRFDPEPPTLAIRPQDPEDPTRIRIEASDAVSSISRGEIELRREGSDEWRSVPAQMESGGFSTLIDDEHLRDGIYELRARVWDAADNERSTDQRTTGDVAKLALPLRVKTRMRVGKLQKLRAHGARRHARIVFIRRPLIGQGKNVRIRGRLTAPGGNALVEVDVEVAAKLAVSGVDFQPVATLKTPRTGRFSYVVPAGASRLLRFRYPGAPKIRAQTRVVHVRVRGASSIKTDKKRAVNGDSVIFSGRLRDGYLPASGKLLELQFFDRGKWRTFRTFRAAPSDGSWSYTYRFDGTHGTRTYRFRLRIPKENGYPFSSGRSRTARVTVRGL